MRCLGHFAGRGMLLGAIVGFATHRLAEQEICHRRAMSLHFEWSYFV